MLMSMNLVVVSSVMTRHTYKSLTGGKDTRRGHLKSTEAIRWKGNLKTNDRGSRGQISPGAEAAGSEKTEEGCRVGGDGGGIDWSSLATIDQLYLWRKA